MCKVLHHQAPMTLNAPIAVSSLIGSKTELHGMPLCGRSCPSLPSYCPSLTLSTNKQHANLLEWKRCWEVASVGGSLMPSSGIINSWRTTVPRILVTAAPLQSRLSSTRLSSQGCMEGIFMPLLTAHTSTIKCYTVDECWSWVISVSIAVYSACF